MKTLLSTIFTLGVVCSLSGCGKDEPEQAPEIKEPVATPVPSPTPREVAEPEAVDLDDNIIYKTVYLGEGDPLAKGDTGTFKLDLKTNSGETVWTGEFSIILDSGQGFPAFDRSADGMRLEEIREVEFPAEFGPEAHQDGGPLTLTIERIENLHPEQETQTE